MSHRTLQPWKRAGTIPVGLKATEQFTVGARNISIHSIVISNESRPLPDARPCWAQQLHEKAEDGVIFAFGHCSGFNDFVKTFPEGFDLGPEDTIDISVNGESGDVYKIKLLYKLVSFP